MHQTGIVKAMLNLKLFTRYGPVLFKIDNLSKEMAITLKTIKEYYDKYPECKEITADELKVFFFSLYPKYKDKKLMEVFFEHINRAEIKNPELLKKALNDLTESHTVSQIVEDGIKYLEEERPESGIMERFNGRIEKFQELVGNIEEAESRVCVLKVKELLEANKTMGIKWRLPALNRILGSPIPGSLGHIFARPEVGKSSMAMAEATAFANQLRSSGRCVLFLGNEEGIKRLKLRMHSAILGKDLEWIKKYPEAADEHFDRMGGNNIKAIEGVNHITEVEMFINSFKPLVCFIDQGTKVAVSGSDKMAGHERLQAAYNIYRNLATKYAMCIITTGQADSASEHRKWLTLNNMDGSKVGIPGELDFAIGITQSPEDGKEKVRHISICKNKLTGKLGKETTFLDIERCRYGGT